MKQIIIETLRYPRYEIRDNLDVDHCIHGGNYNYHDPRCLNCDSEVECHWLYENDECSALEAKSLGALTLALETAIEYIDGRVATLGHNVSECQCDACNWLKSAESVYKLCYRINDSRRVAFKPHVMGRNGASSNQVMC